MNSVESAGRKDLINQFLYTSSSKGTGSNPNSGSRKNTDSSGPKSNPGSGGLGSGSGGNGSGGMGSGGSYGSNGAYQIDSS